MKLFKKSFSPQFILVASFVSVILVGTFLLIQPFALNNSELSLLDGFFTATSATCVTGLIVVDTATHFSLIGKFIILALIQLGGIGVMSFSILFLFFIRGKFGIGSREIIQETLSFLPSTDLKALLKSVFIYTFVIEGIGAALLTIRFMFEMPLSEALISGVFHSVSAFCNAGFSIYSNSLMNYNSDIFINIVISSLIVLGGLGFIVLYELKQRFIEKNKLRKISLHSRIVIRFSLFLIITGAIFIFAFEYNVSMDNMDLKSKILSSIFQSITARTAGFNTIDFGVMSIPTLFFIIILMFIGASPASTGGGIKTTTIIVLFAFIRSRIKDSNNVNLGYNTLPFKIVSKALIVTVFGILIIAVASFMLTVTELNHLAFKANEDKFLEIMFETVSAFCTVGLSTGITASFSSLSKIIIILLMFLGRVGPITVAAIIGASDKKDIKYAEDKILIG